MRTNCDGAIIINTVVPKYENKLCTVRVRVLIVTYLSHTLNVDENAGRNAKIKYNCEYDCMNSIRMVIYMECVDR